MSGAFLGRGVGDFREAARYLCELPYGRNSNRADFNLVLVEGRGTCSTKHALLAVLAHEQEVAVHLMLGIYEMRETNTPGVGGVLAKYGLDCIPEAHCYVSYQGAPVDITRSGVEPSEPIDPFLQEELIAPEQIGEYKLLWHQTFMRRWVSRVGGDRRFELEDLWRIREECIAALEPEV